MGRFADFKNPPIVEAVLGMQFERLPLNIAHVGWLWARYLQSEFPHVLSAPPLQDVVENFSDERTWIQPQIQLTRGVEAGRLRHQFHTDDEERMVQVQDSRLIYNWRKRQGSYPSYDKLEPEFFRHLASFEDVLASAKVPRLAPNQWEVVYVNYIPRGELWNSVSDWPTIFPGFYIPANAKLDSFSGAWSTIIGANEGKLHVELKHARVEGNGQEVIRFQLTARGPVAETAKLPERFEVGHRSIVTAFTEMTSDFAQEYWKRIL